MTARYVFRDKRRKQPKYEEPISTEEATRLAWKRKERYARQAKKSKERWNNMTPVERNIHAVKVSKGMEKAKAMREYTETHAPQPCVGKCEDANTHLYKDSFPNIVWICKSCENMWDRYMDKQAFRPRDGQ